MNILEPVVEISDKPKDNSKKRKNKPNIRQSRKRGRPPRINPTEGEIRQESEFINVALKQEPQELVADPIGVSVPLEDISNVPMAAIPVGSASASPLPLYQVPTGGLAVYLPHTQPLAMQHPVEYSVQSTNNLLVHPQESRNSGVDLAGSSIKQEEMGNVFVMPFGSDLETEVNATSQQQQQSAEPDVIVCESPAEETRKSRKEAIAASIGVASGSSNRKLRELTFKLVELNNKNLQCDSRIDKINDELKTRLQVVETEKKEIEKEIDKVLASIQDWKNAKKQSVKK